VSPDFPALPFHGNAELVQDDQPYRITNCVIRQIGPAGEGGWRGTFLISNPNLHLGDATLLLSAGVEYQVRVSRLRPVGTVGPALASRVGSFALAESAGE